MSLVWITDPHLNFLQDPEAFGQTVARLAPDSTACLFTGDIAEAPSLASCLTLFHKGFGTSKHLYFVLGNHDYYYGSFEDVRVNTVALCAKSPNMFWLRSTWPVTLTSQEGHVVLTGHDGWYDARSGYGWRSQVAMCDFQLISELRRAGRDIPQRLASVAREWVAQAREKLQQSLEQEPTRVLFATHVPPFPKAAWHKGKQSDGHWLPWFCNVGLGEVLAEVAQANPKVQFDVYCGHTHSSGEYKHFENLTVHTGGSDYGAPYISKILTF